MDEILDLMNLLNIYYKDAVPDGIVIEDCAEYDGALSEFCVVCRTHNIDGIKRWIGDNLRCDHAHCIRMFDKKPESIMKFIAASKNIRCYTEEFVKSSGGVQAFLDTYAKEKGTESHTDVSAGGVEKITSFGESEDATEESVVEEPSAGETISEENSPITGNEESISEKHTTEEPVAEETSPAVDNTETKEPEITKLSADEQLQLMLKQQKALDNQKQGIVGEDAECESSTEEPSTQEESASTEEPAPTSASFTQEDVDALFTEEGSFASFSDEQLTDVLSLLKTIDERACYNGLDPDDILSEEELTESLEFLQSFAPGMYKEFFLNLVQNTINDRQRIRVTTLLDDFATFVQYRIGGK